MTAMEIHQFHQLLLPLQIIEIIPLVSYNSDTTYFVFCTAHCKQEQPI
jgi:hypothetical protein